MLLASLAWIMVTHHLSVYVYVYVYNMVMMLKRIIFNLFGNWKQNLISEEDREVVPLDLVMEIMSYMPAQDVLRSKSVCKAWQDMLSSPCFVKLHTSRAQLLPILSIGTRDGCHQPCDGFFTMQGIDTSYYIQFPSLRKQLRLPQPPDQTCCYNLRASCNGLFVFLDDKNGSCFIKNPVLGKQVRLPHLPVSPRRKWERMQLYHVPSSNQYKVVACCANLDSGIMGLYILTVGEDRDWRHLRDCWAHEYSMSKDAPHLIRSFEGQYYYFFHSSYSFDTKDEVLTFDVESEQLIGNELPKEMEQLIRDQSTVKEISEGWTGFMAMVFYNKDIIRIFILEDYKSNKWASKDLIHSGFVDRLREVKQIRRGFAYHILTDDEDRLWFQLHDRITYFCHLKTQKKVYYDFRKYGFVNCVCPSKFTLEACEGM